MKNKIKTIHNLKLKKLKLLLNEQTKKSIKNE